MRCWVRAACWGGDHSCLLSTGETRAGVLCPVRDLGCAGVSTTRGHKDGKAASFMQEEAERAETFQLAEGNAWEGNLISVFVNISLGGDSLFSVTSRDRTRGNGHISNQRKLCLNIKKKNSVRKKLNSGIACSERLSSLRLWRYSTYNWMQVGASRCCSSVYSEQRGLY